MWRPIMTVYDPLKAGSIDGTDTFPHDKAVVRAFASKYKPNKDIVGDPEKTIFVARLNPNTNEDTLERVFSKSGEIERLRLVRDIVTGYSKCYAFIEYMDERSAYRAVQDNHRTILDEKEIFVDHECERTLPGWIPRRLGGGIGGQKESGQLRFGGKSRAFRKPIMVDQTARPEGDTFRDRLMAVDRGGYRPQRDREDRHRSRDRDTNSNMSRHKRRSRSRDRHRDGRRSRSRDRQPRSTARDRHRSRSRD